MAARRRPRRGGLGGHHAARARHARGTSDPTRSLRMVIDDEGEVGLVCRWLLKGSRFGAQAGSRTKQSLLVSKANKRDKVS